MLCFFYNYGMRGGIISTSYFIISIIKFEDIEMNFIKTNFKSTFTEYVESDISFEEESKVEDVESNISFEVESIPSVTFRCVGPVTRSTTSSLRKKYSKCSPHHLLFSNPKKKKGYLKILKSKKAMCLKN